MYIGVKAVVPQENYKLLLTFENDEQGIFDMKPYPDFGPVFKALKDPRLFNTARVCFKTIAWANQADIDPEILYPDSVILRAMIHSPEIIAETKDRNVFFGTKDLFQTPENKELCLQ